jgi:hypothetical protein
MAIDKIQSESINLADTFAFTGTVSGAGGITQADIWRCNSSLTLQANVAATLTAWERADDATQNAYIGNGMSVSSGIFTFPATGIYLVNFRAYYKSTNDTNYFFSRVGGTADNSSYDTLAEQDMSLNVISGTNYTFVTNVVHFDCQNTSTHKMRFQGQSTAVGDVGGHTSLNHTSVSFVRLGDT